MATFRSGNGSTLTVGATALIITKGTINSNARIVENTNSASTATNFDLVVPDNSCSIEGPWDEDAQFDTDVGLTAGSKVTVTFKVGAGAKTIVLTNTTVETCSHILDNQGDIVRWTATTKGGTLTRTTT